MKKLIEKIKNWAKLTALPWLKSTNAWLTILNLLIMFVAYAGLNVDTQTFYSVVVGLGIFVNGAYWLRKLFMK